MAPFNYRDDRLSGAVADFSGEVTDFSGIDEDEDFSGEEAAAESYFTPEVEGELDQIADEVTLLGYADSPELLGSTLSKWVRKLRKKIHKRKKGLKLSLALAPGRAAPGAMVAPTTDTGAGGIMDTLKSPLVLGGAALLVLLMVMRKKKG